MDLTEIKKLIPFYVADTLTPHERRLVDEVLNNTPELLDEVRFWRNVQSVVQQQSGEEASGHLSPQQIVASIEGTLTQDGFNESSVQDHLRACEQCRDDVELIRATYANRQSIPTEPLERSTPNVFRLSVASMRPVYLLPIAAIIVACCIWAISRLWVSPPTQPEAASTVHLTLAYQGITRGGSPPITPTLTLVPATKSIVVTAQVPHTELDSTQYQMEVTTPTAETMQLPILVRPAPFTPAFDTVSLTLDRTTFFKNSGMYTLAIREVLPSSSSGITPETYSYTFQIAQ